MVHFCYNRCIGNGISRVLIEKEIGQEVGNVA